MSDPPINLMTEMSGHEATYRRIRFATKQARELGTVTLLIGSTELPSSAAFAYANAHISATRIKDVTASLDGHTLTIGPAERQAAA